MQVSTAFHTFLLFVKNLIIIIIIYTLPSYMDTY